MEEQAGKLIPQKEVSRTVSVRNDRKRHRLQPAESGKDAR